MYSDGTKRSIKDVLSLTKEYPLEDIVDALLMNDSKKLDEMRARRSQLLSAYDKFCEEIDSNDECRKNIAMTSFKRPD